MKNFTFLFYFSVLFQVSWAQKPIYTKAKLNSVLVYRNAAEMQNSVQINIPAGFSEVVIGNIADVINTKTLQIGLNIQDVTILSSQFTDDYTSDFEKDMQNPRLKLVNDSIKLVSKLIRKYEIDTQAVTKAVELLDKNQTVLVGSNTSSVEQLSKLTDYYISKRVDLTNKLDEIENLKGKNQTILTRLKSSLKTAEEREVENFSDGVLVLKLMSKNASKLDLKINYLTNLAAWSPHYELKGTTVLKPLNFILKANVKQKTGLDWKSVRLTLVDGYPSQNNNAPVLNPWFLQAGPHQVAVSGYGAYNKVVSQNRKMALSAPVEENQILEEVVVTGFNTQENTLNISYDVDIPYDILSNNEPHLIALNQQNILADFEYFSAPNTSKEAFLIAKIKDFSKYNILSAQANVMFENMYIGETRINPNETNDELKVTLGNDRRINIKVEKVEEKSGEKFLSSYREKTVTYDLIVKNNKSESVSISIEDKYPLSNQEVVKVELLENSHAKVDKEKGFLYWNFKLSPSETKKIRVSYQVRYPKNYTINNL